MKRYWYIKYIFIAIIFAYSCKSVRVSDEPNIPVKSTNEIIVTGDDIYVVDSVNILEFDVIPAGQMEEFAHPEGSDVDSIKKVKNAYKLK